MKKLFRALFLCLTLALCVSGSTAALAEAPAATPAPQDERVITDVSPLEDQIRNIVGFTTSTGGSYDFEQADHRSAVQAYGAYLFQKGLLDHRTIRYLPKHLPAAVLTQSRVK